MREDYLTFGRPDLGEEEIAEVIDTLRSGWIGTGPKVAAFEAAFAEYIGTQHAVAVSSCTAALHLSVATLGLGDGDEVITTPMTFCATANAIIHAGAKPVFIDIDRRTLNIDPEQVEAAITPATRAILPVHFAGRPCDIAALRDVAHRHGLGLIEDAAHAVEARTPEAKVGTTADLSCFSFYVTKNVVTAEGGMVTTDRADWADRIKMLALHGMNRDAWQRYSDAGYKHYQVEEPGFKYNMTDIQAALGIHQLRRTEENLRRRNDIWARYDEAFADSPLQIPASPEVGTVHARHLYTMMVDAAEAGLDRDQLQEHLHAAKIGTGIHYVAVHLHPFYARTWGYRRGDFPQAEYASDRTLSLPLGSGLSDEDVENVIVAVKRILKGVGYSKPGKIREDFITLVSGLPRSGTSMLMKMLDAGGLPPLSDGIRRADEDNPGGYYELEEVKQAGRAAPWTVRAGGKAVKVISQLLETLPADRRYKVVFARRAMGEILASQREMLYRKGRHKDAVGDEEMAAVFGRHLSQVEEWLVDQPHMEVLYVDYASALADPVTVCGEIKTFLGLPLDEGQMAAVVDPELYRQRV